MHRHQPVLATTETEVGEGGAIAGPIEVRKQGVDHHVADQMDLVISIPLGAEVGHAVRRRREEKVAEPIRHDSVDLLGHVPVAAPQTRLDVGDVDSELGRHQRACDRAVDVTDHRHQVDRAVADNSFELDHHRRGLFGLRPRPDPQVDVRSAHPEVVEEHVAHVVVVVLTAVDQGHPNASGLGGP